MGPMQQHAWVYLRRDKAASNQPPPPTPPPAPASSTDFLFQISQALDQEQKFLYPPLGSSLFPSTEDL